MPLISGRIGATELQARVGQRVCRVCWSKGKPFFEFGLISKLGKKSGFWVNNEIGRSNDWSFTWREAIDKEYATVFRYHESKSKFSTWEISDTVHCVIELRRLERKLERRFPFAFER